MPSRGEGRRRRGERERGEEEEEQEEKGEKVLIQDKGEGTLCFER